MNLKVFYKEEKNTETELERERRKSFERDELLYNSILKLKTEIDRLERDCTSLEVENELLKEANINLNKTVEEQNLVIEYYRRG